MTHGFRSEKRVIDARKVLSRVGSRSPRAASYPIRISVVSSAATSFMLPLKRRRRRCQAYSDSLNVLALPAAKLDRASEAAGLMPQPTRVRTKKPARFEAGLWSGRMIVPAILPGPLARPGGWPLVR